MEQKTENQSGLGATIKGFLRWSMTPPQSYPMYVLCLFLVLGLSYYAGTLKPKKTPAIAPQATSLSHN
jgi:hypothetical protein